MWRFIIKRVLLIVPTIFLVLTLIFIIAKSLPGDPVLAAMRYQNNSMDFSSDMIDSRTYNIAAKNLNLDKPEFYFSIVPSNFPSDFYKLSPLQKKFMTNLFRQYGNAELVFALTHEIDEIVSEDFSASESIKSTFSRFIPDLNYLSSTIKGTLNTSPNTKLSQILDLIQHLSGLGKRNNSYLPKIVWHGRDNQYHTWIRNAFLLNLGASTTDGQPALKVIFSSFRWTFIINFFSIIIGYSLAILIGVYAGWNKGLFDKISSIIMYLIYSIPVFWMATILVVFFTTSEYGSWTNIFPSVGIWNINSSDSFVQMIGKNFPLLVLPVFILSTNLLAFIARIVRNSVAEEKNKFYVRHARTKGLSEQYILWYHVFRNASFPLITLIASVFPAALAGSLVVEVICNIPGTGRVLYNAILGQDWAIVNGIVMIYTLLTVTGLLISDILYRWVDPRLKWDGA
ncbi:MAG: ABC transporter permease [Saprospiraceae bacterium]|nr:ABC transporter permease [Saprospiraceae bacterium]